MRRRKLKKGVKVIAFLIVLALLILLGIRVYNNVKESRAQQEKQLVEEYVQCLKDNWTQRDYCARQVGSEYHYMDLLIEKYGYSYKQVGYDLYLVEER